MTLANNLPHGPIGGGIFPGFERTYGPWPSKPDSEVWPQWVHGHLCGGPAARDYQIQLHEETQYLSETTEEGEINSRKLLLNSPPTTPPLDKKRKMIVDPSRFPKAQASDTKIKKTKASKLPITHRPLTRSTGSACLALHSRKGYVIVRELSRPQVMSFETYLQEHVSRLVTCSCAMHG